MGRQDDCWSFLANRAWSRDPVVVYTKSLLTDSNSTRCKFKENSPAFDSFQSLFQIPSA